MENTIKKIVAFFFKFLPENAPHFIYTIILLPKPLKVVANFFITLCIGESMRITEGLIALNKKDPVVSGALALGFYEKSEAQLVRNILKQGMTVIDIGANIGYFSVIAADRIGQSGRVIAFEPDAENFGFLMKTIHLNNFKNVMVCQCALSDRNGETKLFISEENKGDHRMYATKEGVEKNRQSVTVHTVTLDDYLDSIGVHTVDFIKMDVQGVEWLVLKGMKKTLSQSTNISLLMEFWPYGITQSGGDPLQVLEGLLHSGFTLYMLDRTGGTYAPMNDCKSFIVGLKGKKAYTNLYCVKN